MKSFSKFLALGAVLAASSSFAFADPIAAGSSFDLSGNDSYTTSMITFGTTQLGAADDIGTQQITGTFASYLTDGTTSAGGSTVSFTSPLYYSQGTQTLPATQIFSITQYGGGETFTFDITGYTASYVDFGGGNTSLLVNGLGTFQGSGTVLYSSTPGSFIFSSQVVGGITNTTFSASAAVSGVTPEPSSLVLLGTGLFGAAGLMFMRRRNTSALI